MERDEWWRQKIDEEVEKDCGGGSRRKMVKMENEKWKTTRGEKEKDPKYHLQEDERMVFVISIW